MKGDRIEVVIDAGGSTRTYEIKATRAGRRVETTHGRGVVEVTEVTRSGRPVRTARFMASRVLALVEYPAEEPTTSDRAAGAADPRIADGVASTRS
ncbi:MAG TPA: hypothetical protein VGO16_19955 [Pseudonocardiaceae bacterium]|jgi:hypothetical protein|nr:hypothetical protein [Pseudonocardiaceae bacterium]